MNGGECTETRSTSDAIAFCTADVVARADDLDVETQRLVRRSGGMLAEPGADDRDLHANSPVRPVLPTRRVSSSRVADRPSGNRRSGWL